MEELSQMIGVSPAFMVSLYGPGFSIGNFCEGLLLVRELGFSAYQPEIPVGTALPEWVNGTIPWKPLLANLVGAGYDGSWDIEIGCRPDQVRQEYGFGLNYLRSLKKL
jgi:hypothetical protein